MSLRSNFARAYAGVMSAVKQAMEAVTLGIIEMAPRLGMLSSAHRLASE
jgi:hypothetical protein